MQEFEITRIASDDVLLIGLKKILQCEGACLWRHLAGGVSGDVEEGIARVARDIVLDLMDKRRNEIDGLMDSGKLVEQFHHAVVILERVQANPGQAIAPGDQVLVKRLMLV